MKLQNVFMPGFYSMARYFDAEEKE